MTVWKAVQKMAPSKNMAIIGSSAGGGLTLAMVLKAKMDKLPLPVNGPMPVRVRFAEPMGCTMQPHQVADLSSGKPCAWGGCVRRIRGRSS